ncbi:MAG: hypothetical protein M0Q29_03760 [Thiopseudomonas sp.]|nr:hypothetical protein [Thiopseudomonas sp.]MCK9464982.1 hypothetical protein [Thiopseudomonas sp.]
MAAILILAGLLIFLLGWLWLIWRAFMFKPFWGLAVVLPPLAVIFLLLHWRRAVLPLMALFVGVGVLVAGSYQLATEQPEKWQKIMAWHWFSGGKEQALEHDGQVQGTIFGQRFLADSVELDKNVVYLRENSADGFAAQIKITLLSVPNLQQQNGLFVDVLPDDQQPVPQIEILWYDYQRGQRLIKQIKADYTLHIALNSQPPNKLVGNFYLALAKSQHTQVSGVLEVNSDKLRYQGTQVDLSYDHAQTIDYLLHNYSRSLLEVDNLHFKRTSKLDMFSVPLSVQGQLLIANKSFPVQFTLTKDQRWQVVDSNLAAIAQQLAARDSIQVEQAEEFSLAHLLANFNGYLNQEMQVKTINRHNFTGYFQGLNAEGGLIFKRSMHKGGEVTFQLQPDEIEEIMWMSEQ